MIIEKATGKPYADQLARRIARPLGLSGTYLPGNETRIRGPHPRHYSRLWSADPDAKTYDVTEQNASYAWAAGGIVSTTRDLSRFLAALHDGTLLPPAQQKEIWNPEGVLEHPPETTLAGADAANGPRSAKTSGRILWTPNRPLGGVPGRRMSRR
ncbi:serine hydrolase [Nonomuraea sp. H19]|uniref:serine hydrolase n=1 Tax=Nonomuraea sp. H19 TaxID=3452206 RepID=UPI003F8C5241